jgi:hypothetical protein
MLSADLFHCQCLLVVPAGEKREFDFVHVAAKLSTLFWSKWPQLRVPRTCCDTEWFLSEVIYRVAAGCC